jgi:DNA-binding NarL/FixJ family response regulator
MDTINILVICRHPDILQTILRLINNNAEWDATGTITDEEAMAAFNTTPFDLVLLGNGIEPENEERLTDTFKASKPGIPVIQHYGGGSGLLFAEIYEGLSNSNK